MNEEKTKLGWAKQIALWAGAQLRWREVGGQWALGFKTMDGQIERVAVGATLDDACDALIEESVAWPDSWDCSEQDRAQITAEAVGAATELDGLC